MEAQARIEATQAFCPLERFLFYFLSLISASDTPSALVERVDCNTQGFELCFILWL